MFGVVLGFGVFSGLKYLVIGFGFGGLLGSIWRSNVMVLNVWSDASNFSIRAGLVFGMLCKFLFRHSFISSLLFMAVYFLEGSLLMFLVLCGNGLGEFGLGFGVGLVAWMDGSLG